MGVVFCSIDEAGDVQLGQQRAPQQHHRGQYMRPYLRVANVLEERAGSQRREMEMNFEPKDNSQANSNSRRATS